MEDMGEDLGGPLHMWGTLGSRKYVQFTIASNSSQAALLAFYLLLIDVFPPYHAIYIYDIALRE